MLLYQIVAFITHKNMDKYNKFIYFIYEYFIYFKYSYIKFIRFGIRLLLMHLFNKLPFPNIQSGQLGVYIYIYIYIYLIYNDENL